MFVPDTITYIEVGLAMIGLFIAGWMSKKKQAAKRYQREQLDKRPPQEGK